MANIVPKKNQRGAVRGWEIRTKLTTDKGATFTFYASATTFEASDVEGFKALLSDCEKDAAKTGAYYSDDIPKEILNKIPSWEKVATD